MMKEGIAKLRRVGALADAKACNRLPHPPSARAPTGQIESFPIVMKLFRALCMVLGAWFLTADAATTAFVGQSIGSIAVQGNGVNTIVAVAFTELSAADECVSVANIVSTEGLDAGDVVSVYWNDGFETWTLAVDAQGVKSWEKNGKKFSVGSDGQVTQSAGADASSVRPPVGSGIWLVHKAGGSFTFHLFGAYLEPSATTAAVGTKTLMGNPGLVAKAPTITGMSSGDTIQFATGGGLLNTYTYNATKGQWGYWDSDNKPAWGGAPTIPAGTGFWYVSEGGAVTFAW